MGLPLLFILLIGVMGALMLLRKFAYMPPAAVAKLVRQVGGGLSLAAAALLLMRGRWEIAMAVGGVGLWLLGVAQPPDWTRNIRWPGSSGAPNVSKVRSAMIGMELDHDTGAIEGAVLAGEFAGRRLAELTRDEARSLLHACLADDLEGARLLEAYLDRRFAGWRDAEQPNADGAGGRARGASAAMSEDEAYEVLGLAKGANAEDIARAHRNLMKKLHPDLGGTTSLAARINEAKDILIRRHTQTP